MYVDDNGTKTEVPILIDNINNPDSKSTLHLNNETDPSKWILVKRFFLFEKIVDSNYITFAKFMKFRVNMTKDGSYAKAYIPIFEILYSRKEIGGELKSYVSFQSEYYTTMKHFMKVMLGLLITACVIVFIIVIYRVWVWIKLNPKILLPDSWFIDLLITPDCTAATTASGLPAGANNSSISHLLKSHLLKSHLLKKAHTDTV